ncbi:MAG: nucleoside recognition protein [Desulfobacterales bacterium]|nr:nucleoside recognition protein [Desulfobacterales bacterium]
MIFKKASWAHQPFLISFAVSAALLGFGLCRIENFNTTAMISKLLWPLARLMLFIGIGLAFAQIIEASGWTRFLGAIAAPFFKFGRLGNLCSAAFTTAFVSGVASNAMLLEFYKEDKITRRQLYLTNLINQFPAYFLHLPTTVFIVIPLTGWAGVLYFVITFAATLLRTALFLIYGHFQPTSRNETRANEFQKSSNTREKSKKNIWEGIKKKLPGRISAIARYVVPVYIFVFVINSMGFFSAARQWLAEYVVTTFIPMESLSLIILSFAAEFTSGFAAAGALLDAGVLTTQQTVAALLIGNIIAFPLRALRHQLPRYIGIFAPKMGTQLLLMGQGFRVLSIIFVGTIYYYLSR